MFVPLHLLSLLNQLHDTMYFSLRSSRDSELTMVDVSFFFFFFQPRQLF